ncbi:MAG: PhoX family phosphatase [Xanthomonadales bacterium]|nr:PhoX family phosphatase [Xanthomonadales bacterium]
MDERENLPLNPCVETQTTLEELVSLRLSRRGLIRSAIATAGLAGLGGMQALAAHGLPPFRFTEISRGVDHTHHVAAGHDAQLLIRWGDPLFSDAPAFDPHAQTAAAQRRQFGYNNDFIGYIPLVPEAGQDERGILCVNHEYTTSLLMLPDVGDEYPASITAAQGATERAAHGGSVFEVVRQGDQWQAVIDSPYNRRITADSTPMTLTGPAAGHERLRTGDDPEGRTVAGTMNNCAGGITPWGTYLMAEENVNGNFMGSLPEGHRETRNYERFGVPGGWYAWGQHVDRYDVGKEPNEPNRFGWIVEVDPHNPQAAPRKHTALGRFKHEGAESVVAPNGQVVVYMGDDQRFDYVYKFISKGRYDPAQPAANRELLTEGTLYVARFDADGTVSWLPLRHGYGPLTAANGFHSQADVMIEARSAADLLGATPMDRPEDVEPDPRSGSVWIMLTNNYRRTEAQVDAANPRAANNWGQIIQLVEPEGDFTALRSRWEFLVRCGDPKQPEVMASWNPATSDNGWFGSPDNCAVDPAGRLWVSTDGNSSTGAADGLWALSTEGTERGTGKAFFRCPVGAELCGPRFTPGGDTLFLAIQHPGDGDGATFDAPSTRWPDFEDGKPPRPSIVAIRRKGGGPIGI